MKKENVKISILVPIHGVEKYIERCAVSLFEQSYDNIEYVFVNDCSRDNSIGVLKQVIERYPKRHGQVKIINHSQNRGLAAARLTGLLESTGDYVWFVDSDDWIEKNALEILEPYIKAQKDAIWFDYYKENQEGTTERVRMKPTIMNMVSLVGTVCVWAVIYKRNLFFDNNIFPVEDLNYSEDYILNGRIISVIKDDICLHKSLYHYNEINENSYSNNLSLKSLLQMAEGLLIVYAFYNERKNIKKYRKYMMSGLLDIYYKIYNSSSTEKVLDRIEKCVHDISPVNYKLMLCFRTQEHKYMRYRYIVRFVTKLICKLY